MKTEKGGIETILRFSTIPEKHSPGERSGFGWVACKEYGYLFRDMLQNSLQSAADSRLKAQKAVRHERGTPTLHTQVRPPDAPF
jgi:hypothetical protein